MYRQWTCPLPDGTAAEEWALCFDQGRDKRLLVLPALFDEANKLRRQTVEVMRRLDLSGIDCFLPDLAGWNESLRPVEAQTLGGWRQAAQAASEQFEATHLLVIRGSALLAPEGLPGWAYAPIAGRQVLRPMLRARSIAAREAGHEERLDELSATGRSEGIELAGWRLGADLFRELEEAGLPERPLLAEIEQSALGGPGLWLRAEPDEEPEQADTLAAIIAIGMSEA